MERGRPQVGALEKAQGKPLDRCQLAAGWDPPTGQPASAISSRKLFVAACDLFRFESTSLESMRFTFDSSKVVSGFGTV